MLKKFLTFLLTCAIAMSTMVTTGCSSSQALADVTKFEPVVLNVLNLACVISPGAPLCGTATALITSDYNTVIQLWTAYNANVAAGTSTVAAWNDLNAAFQTFEQDSAAVFS